MNVSCVPNGSLLEYMMGKFIEKSFLKVKFLVDAEVIKILENNDVSLTHASSFENSTCLRLRDARLF